MYACCTVPDNRRVPAAFLIFALWAYIQGFIDVGTNIDRKAGKVYWSVLLRQLIMSGKIIKYARTDTIQKNDKK
ncbi:MAG: hypothetical protein EA408_09065 [Marinilabiliales bacterium]|nr:MAG: hypothetical protein EA408_09065 [Marinilabiliales bacterium]